MADFPYTISVAGDLFDGFCVRLPYSEWKSVCDDFDEYGMTHEDRVAAFERYQSENGEQKFYIEEEFDENGEENEDYDPYLYIRPYEEGGEGTWQEIDLETAVDWVEEHYGERCRLYANTFVTKESLKEAVAVFRKNPHWRGIYDNAPTGAKKLLSLTFWPAVADDQLYDACKEEYHDLVEATHKALKVKDLEYLIANKGEGGAAAMAAKQYEELLKVAKEREALKGVSVSGLLKELKQAYKDWEANKLNDQQYNDVAHRCQALYERLAAIGRVSDAMADKFENEYTANMYAVND